MFYRTEIKKLTLALVGVLTHKQSYEKPPLFYQANKFGLKTLLHMCALSAATQLKGKLKDYFDRKVAQGKKKMSVLNAATVELSRTNSFITFLLV